MLKKFTTKELIIIPALAASWIIFDLIFASFLTVLTGIPLISALITAIMAGFVMLITIKIIPKFGSLTLLLTLFGLLELPTPLGGVAGFWPKIIINGLSGFFGDIWMYFTGYKKRWNLFVGFYILSLVNLLTFFFFLIKLGIPNADKTISLAYIIIPAYWIMGTLGILLGMFVWNKIKDKRLIKQISN